MSKQHEEQLRQPQFNVPATEEAACPTCGVNTRGARYLCSDLWHERPVTPQAEPGASEPQFLAEKIVELIYSKAMVTQRLCWSDQKEKMAAEVAALLAIPAVVPQASAGLSDEGKARQILSCLHAYKMPLVQQDVDYLIAAIAEARQQDGERIAEAHERAERAIEVLLRETSRAEAAEARADSLQRELDAVDDRLARRPAIADTPNRLAAIERACATAGKADSLAATLEKVNHALAQYGMHAYHECLYRWNVVDRIWEHRGAITTCRCGLADTLASLSPAPGTEDKAG